MSSLAPAPHRLTKPVSFFPVARFSHFANFLTSFSQTATTKSDIPSLPAMFGSLPTNAGWQPALPGIDASSVEPERRSDLAIRVIA